MPANTQTQVITQAGGAALDPDALTLEQNDPNVESAQAVLTLEAPDKYEEVEYRGRNHTTKFIPRTVQTVNGTAGDDTVVALNADIQPIAGETDVDEQDYPTVQVYNVTQAAVVDVADIDYAANEITLADNPADGDEVKVYSVLVEGDIQLRVRNNLGQIQGTVYPWTFSVHRFADMEQNKAGNEVHLHGGVTLDRFDEIELILDSPRQLVWEDQDYTDAGFGAYVSTIEQELDFTL